MSTDFESPIQFTGQVAIVTGAGGGLGRQHALSLAARGAKVLVNDVGGRVDGTVDVAFGATAGPSAAQSVVDAIVQSGGVALANHASVTDALRRATGIQNRRKHDAKKYDGYGTKHDAECEDVARVTDSFAACLFRRHIGDRAEQRARPCLQG